MEHAFTNELINETSPYLLQHAHNPVNWKAWSDETLAEAEQKQKLLLISVGYAACHWCHVMERESFEDSTVAAVMNANFINVKVDREERPDVDQVYMNAIQLMKGRGGWPLNIIALPDGRPIWGETYVQKEQWIKALQQIQDLYEDSPEKLVDYAARLEEGIKSIDLVTINTGQIDFSSLNTDSIVNDWSRRFDTRLGGTEQVPKFMMPNNYHFMLRYAFENKDEALMNFVNTTLTNIAYGGVYDQVGGGFARYSTDAKWHIPHFEKMLYDNSQLVSLYSDAYSISPNPLYKEVVYETLEYIRQEMTHETGAFYSSLDADSKGPNGELEEGTYYTYDEKEIDSIMGDDAILFKEYYNVNSYGKWQEEGSYVLIRKKDDATILTEFEMDQAALDAKKKTWKKTLLDYRNQRPRPGLDDKTLTSWNGLMLKGYVDAYRVFREDTFLQVAIKNAEFLRDHQILEDGRLWHTYKDGKSSINGYLEDYAALASGYLSLYEVSLDQQWLDLALKTTQYAREHFMDKDSRLYYFTSDQDSKLVSRSQEYRDNVIPSSNSIMAKNLLQLGHYFDLPEFIEDSQAMLHNVQPEIAQYPSGFSNWLDLALNYQGDYYELVVVGEGAKDKIASFNSQYIPNKLIAGSIDSNDAPLLKNRWVEGETFIYVCVNNTCKLPVTEIEKALPLMGY
ncbi:MAG: thioredoxin domain-containing protein [Gilvibacter sp.]